MYVLLSIVLLIFICMSECMYVCMYVCMYRCSSGKVLEIHNSFHAAMGNRTRNCNIPAVRDALVSVGGVCALLPLFPQLLTEQADYDKVRLSLPLPY